MCTAVSLPNLGVSWGLPLEQSTPGVSDRKEEGDRTVGCGLGFVGQRVKY